MILALRAIAQKYHLTENYYIVISETIVDVNNYIPFKITNSQTVHVIHCNFGVPSTGQATSHTPP